MLQPTQAAPPSPPTSTADVTEDRAETARRELADWVLQETGATIGEGWKVVWEGNRKRVYSPGGRRFGSPSQVVSHFHEQRTAGRELAERVVQETGATIGEGWKVVWEGGRKRVYSPEGRKFGSPSEVVKHFQKQRRLFDVADVTEDRAETARRELADWVLQATGATIGEGWKVVWESVVYSPGGRRFGRPSEVVSHFHEQRRLWAGSPIIVPNNRSTRSAVAVAVAAGEGEQEGEANSEAKGDAVNKDGEKDAIDVDMTMLQPTQAAPPSPPTGTADDTEDRAETARRELAERVLQETGATIGEGWKVVWEGGRKRVYSPGGRMFGSPSQVVSHFHEQRRLSAGAETARRELAERVVQETGATIGEGWKVVWEGGRKRVYSPEGRRFSSPSEVVSHFHEQRRLSAGSPVTVPNRSTRSAVEVAVAVAAGEGEEEGEEEVEAEADAGAETARRELADRVLQETGATIGEGWKVVWEGGRKRVYSPEGRRFSSPSEVVKHFQKHNNTFLAASAAAAGGTKGDSFGAGVHTVSRNDSTYREMHMHRRRPLGSNVAMEAGRRRMTASLEASARSTVPAVPTVEALKVKGAAGVLGSPSTPVAAPAAGDVTGTTLNAPLRAGETAMLTHESGSVSSGAPDGCLTLPRMLPASVHGVSDAAAGVGVDRSVAREKLQETGDGCAMVGPSSLPGERAATLIASPHPGRTQVPFASPKTNTTATRGSRGKHPSTPLPVNSSIARDDNGAAVAVGAALGSPWTPAMTPATVKKNIKTEILDAPLREGETTRLTEGPGTALIGGYGDLEEAPRHRRQHKAHCVTFAHVEWPVPAEEWATPGEMQREYELSLAQGGGGGKGVKAASKANASGGGAGAAAFARRAIRGRAVACAAVEATLADSVPGGRVTDMPPMSSLRASASAPDSTPLSQVYRSTKRARHQRVPEAEKAFVTPGGDTTLMTDLRRAKRTKAGGASSPLGLKNSTAMNQGARAVQSGGKYLGRRVSCYWKAEKAWYDGTLVRWTVGEGYLCLYDDGDFEEGIDVPDDSIRILS